MADGQRAPNTITIEPERAALSGDSLRAEIARLQAQADKEEADARAKEAEAKPPRPVGEIMQDFMARVTNLLGFDHHLDGLHREYLRATGK